MRDEGVLVVGATVLAWEPGLVTVRFADGASTLLDYGGKPEDGEEGLTWYRGIARLCGYDDVARYAVHHDLAHLWLAETLWGIESPTLWAVAHAEEPPAINKSEEYLVNTVQWTLATGDRDWNAEYLKQIMGDDWRARLDALARVFGSVD